VPSRDLPDRQGFVQAWQLPEGRYHFELRQSGAGARFNRRPIVRPAVTLAAGEIRFFGVIETIGCGSHTVLRLSQDWQAIAPEFARHFDGLPVPAVTLPHEAFGVGW